MAPFGPFEVDPEQIERLGPAFTEYVNELLVREGAQAKQLGHQLRLDNQDSTADGGVDATLDSSQATAWLPHGKSCWQFKRGDLAPAACAKELAKASWAQELLKNGSTYTLVLGRRLGDKKLEARRAKLIDQARVIGLLASGQEHRIQVLDANALARWSSEFPSLAISPALGAPGRGVIDYATWSASNRHEFQWVPNAERIEAIDSLRKVVQGETFNELHVIGESGVGKTRLVMEALRIDGLASLVVYVPDQQAVTGEIFAYVLSGGRTAIFVVDECTGRSHEKLAERVPGDAALRLVTIGEPDDYALRAPVLELTTMTGEEIEAFLRANYSTMSPEARRFIGEQSLGNVRFSIVLAKRILEQGTAQAAELISRTDAEQLVEALLPEGRPFYLASVLALFERVGWDKEVAGQLLPLAAFAKATELELRAVGEDLESRGLLTKQGRYRAVAPHPVATVLAASGWRLEGGRIIEELLPTINSEMALSLFSRVAALGRYEPARKVLRELMSDDGPFGSLESIEEHGLGQVLTQLAIVAPDEMMQHLGSLVRSASLDELRSANRSRRDLVWTLEKLVWHRNTFRPAADALLRLALAENETWANNATGTWVDLFGTMLPGTAARPSERAEYLSQVVDDGDAEKRLIAIQACSRALTAHHEAITVSGELQGGALVEPRGTPTTWDEAGDYRRAVIEILNGLTADEDGPVAQAAIDVLIGAVHPLIDDYFIGDDLTEALKGLPADSLTRLRREIEHLISLHERHGPRERPDLLDRVKRLSAALPPATERQQVRVLLDLRPWDLEKGELESRLAAQLQLLARGDREWVLDVAKREELAAAWELGAALAISEGEHPELTKALVAAFPTNPAALAGYLRKLVDEGDETVVDRFLDGALAAELEPRDILSIATRGPASNRSKRRVLAIAQQLPVAQAAIALFGWQQHLDDGEAGSLARGWLDRIVSQQDYNALVDWINLLRDSDSELPDSLRPVALRVVMMRTEFPEMQQQRWDWSQLAARFVADRPVDLARLILDLIESDHLMIHEGDSEAQVLISAASAEPEAVWAEIGKRLLAGSWRVQMEIRGWLLRVVPVEILERWIEGDIERARAVAAVSPAGRDSPSPTARLLLERFADDEEIRSGLWGEFMSGVWTGPESARLEGQIAQLENWRSVSGESEGIRTWAAEMIKYLEARHDQALQDESERGY